MTTPAATKTSGSNDRFAGWAAIASGLIGLCAFACLVAYITTPAMQMQASGFTDPMGRRLVTCNFVGAILQVLLMIPVAVRLRILSGERWAKVSRGALVVGIAALFAVALLRFLALVNPAVSDILFMVPMGLVGVWLIAVNWLLKSVLSRWLRIPGTVAGIALVLVCINFLFNGGMGEFAHPYAYASNVRFHIGLALSGLPGFTLFPIWSILLALQLTREPPGPRSDASHA